MAQGKTACILPASPHGKQCWLPLKAVYLKGLQANNVDAGDAIADFAHKATSIFHLIAMTNHEL